MTAPRPDHRPRHDGESERQWSQPLGPHTPQPQTRVPQERAPRRGEPGWDWPLIVIEGLTVVVFAPLAVVLIVTDAADRMAGWWWLVVAGMLAAWAGESVGKLAHHVSAVHAARKRAHSGNPHTNQGAKLWEPGSWGESDGHAGPPLSGDGNPKPGDPW